VKVTLSDHVAPGAIVVPHVFAEIANLFASVPLALICEIFTVAVPVLVSVTLCGALGLPTFCPPLVVARRGRSG
jgi:hypothetical protein